VTEHGVLAWGGTTREGSGRVIGHWHLRAAPYVMIRAKRLFPRASQHRAGWLVISDTPETSRDIEWLADRFPLTMDVQAKARLMSRADEHRRVEAQVAQILSRERVLSSELRAPARAPYDFQEVAADLAISTRRLLLADDVGLGKTMSGMLVLRADDALPALVVTLTHLPPQWLGEFEKTLPWLNVHVVSQMDPYDPTTRRGVKERPDVLVMGYSKLRGWGDHLAGDVRTVIFDEMQELRLPDSKKYSAAAQIADTANYRVGLTATPVYNYGGEIHSVVSVLAPDLLGSRDEFVREWCTGTKARVKDPAALGLYLREQGVMLRRTRAEVGRELPPVVHIPHVVDCDSDLLDRLTGDVVSLADAILARDTSRTDRFRASGELDWKLRRATGLAKAPYVADFVRLLLESEERVVLYGWHRDVYEQWRRRLADLKPAFYTGTESPTQKLRSFREFTEGDSRVLIVSLRAGAGLDGLQNACKVAVFGELDWSPGIHHQCIGRLHRDGQAEPVVAYFLVSEEGSDPVVAEVLNVKRMQSEPILDPYLEALDQAEGTENRVRALAKSVLERRRDT
jgi:SNF2 family DNA or RNA helicase